MIYAIYVQGEYDCCFLDRNSAIRHAERYNGTVQEFNLERTFDLVIKVKFLQHYLALPKFSQENWVNVRDVLERLQ